MKMKHCATHLRQMVHFVNAGYSPLFNYGAYSRYRGQIITELCADMLLLCLNEGRIKVIVRQNWLGLV